MKVRKRPFFSLKEIISLLIESVANLSANDFVEKCRAFGMEEQPYLDLGFDRTLPDFDKGYNFNFNTEDNNKTILEILQKGDHILQAGFQIIYPPSLFFAKIKKHYPKIISFLEAHYGVGFPMKMGNSEILNYGDDKTVCYVSKAKVNNGDVLTLRVGNKLFWG